MQNIAYPLGYEIDPLCICETSCSEFHSGERPGAWTDEELAGIRLALRKLTALRVDNPEDAEDLVQETLLTLVRKKPPRIEKGVMIWAMGVLRRKVGNYYRRTQRYTMQEAEARSLSAGITPAASPESHLLHSEILNMVDGVLVSLSPRDRAPVDLYLAGRPTAEIVSLLHPERYQNIVNRLHRGRKKLARVLLKHGYRRKSAAGRRRKPADVRDDSRVI
jgi:RNA polymerase sigma factor (sigma-70 family)